MIFSEIMDAFVGLKNSLKGGKRDVKNLNEKEIANFLFGKGSKLSITKRAEKSIAYYPIVCSDDLDMKTQQIIAKSVERNIADMIKLIVTNQSDLIPLDSPDAKAEFIAKFRENNFLGKEFSGIPASESSTSSFFEAIFNSSSVKNKIKEDTTPLEQSLDYSILNESASDGSVKEEESFKPGVYISKDSMKSEKAINGMPPTIMTAKVLYVGDEGETTSTDVAIAIKTILHTLPGHELRRAISEFFLKGSAIIRFIQWTTGEIGFFKELLLNINDAKESLKHRTESSRNAKNVVVRLQQRVSKSGYKLMTNGKGFLPTTTLVLSSAEADQIKEDTGISILEIGHADRLCRDLGLITIIIVDELSGSMLVYHDSENSSFDRVSIKDEEKENSSNKVIQALLGAISKTK